MSAFKLRFLHRGTPTPTPTPTPSAAVTYDTSIGNGVDSSGFASLPLHSGAKYIYLNGSSGSDANSGLTTLLPKATLAAATALITSGAGDQILIAEGTTYAVAIDSHVHLPGKGGLSPAYPTVIQSYDSTDPTNTAKYGRATGSNRPKFTGVADSYFLSNSDTPTNYMAFRGLELNANNFDGAAVGCLGTASGQHNYQLWENIRFFYTMLNYGMAASFGTPGFKYIARNCSFYGQWHSSGDQQGILVSYIDGLCAEDCVFWHCGWKVGASRSDIASAGGPTNLSHAIYAQDETRNNVVRRCVMVDCALDGGRIKGGGLYQNNLSINNPIQCYNGGGNQYVWAAPFGVYQDISGSAGIGGNDLNGGTNGAWGWTVVDGKPGSWCHHNLLARSNNPLTGQGAYLVDAQNEALTQPPCPAHFAVDCYVDIEYNTSYSWVTAGNTVALGTNPVNGPTDFSKIHSTFNHNVSDDATSGTNTNNGSVSFPNAYTLSSLLTAINAGYTDLTTAATDWINNPDQRGWRNGVGLLKAGYATAIQSLGDLRTTMQVTIGIPDTGLFIGALDGSSLTGSMPSGFTLDSDGRTWRYDGTGTAGGGSVTITETNGSSSHNTIFTWSRSPRPVLSLLTKTSSSTATISTNTNGGAMFWMVLAQATSPDWSLIRIGLGQDLTTPALAFNKQTVSASGTQTLTGLSNLTAGNYLHVAQLDANNNPSLTATLAL